MPSFQKKSQFPNTKTMLNSISQAPLSKNLQRLFMLRNFAILVQCLTFMLVYKIIALDIPWTELIVVVALLAVLNLLTWVRLHRKWPVSNIEFFAQLLIDIFALSALLYFSGGSTNPFISLYLLPITIAAATLPWRYTWVLSAITIGCYTILLFNYIPLPHDHSKHLVEFSLHVSGMWLTFVLSTIIIAWYVVRMSTSIRDRDRDLALAREQALRNEQIIGLGTLAAGAAHELGTPLSTMAVIAGELQKEYPENTEFQNNIQILRDQITHCKQTLTQLLAKTGQTRVEGVSQVPVDKFMNSMLEKWKLIRPSVKFNYHIDGAHPTPKIMDSQLLSQSILNLLNNAADASSECIEITSHWDKNSLHLEIVDDGEGLSAEAAQRAGEAFFTSKAPGQGFGIGLFLANANIERLGGTVHLFNLEKGGACTQVTIPLIGG
jgi:two-component system, sensor histidine kinase RegB